MRWRTPARAKIDRAAKPLRDAFAAEHWYCWRCGTTRDLCVDEIVSGMSGRVVGVQVRLAWTRLCGSCNCGPLNGSAPSVLLAKLALKWIHDRPHFDLPCINVMRGRDPGAIEFHEVIPTICRFLDGWRGAA